MDINSGAILDFFVSQRGMYKGDLETAACKDVLSNLKERGLQIKNLVTDENTKVAKMVRDFFPTIGHNYDVWHKARLLKKKLTAIAKKLPKIEDFVTPIVNHFWYAAKECNGNPKILIEIFHSCLLHLINEHSWDCDPFKPLKLKLQEERNKNRRKKKTQSSKDLHPYFETLHECKHGRRAKHRKLRGMKWLDIKSEEFKALFKYFTDTRLMNSIRMCCNFFHTGNLEVYHNVRLKLLPKRTSYSLHRMIMGSMLTAIEVNKNLVTDQSKKKKFWAYSKSQKKYIRKSRVMRKNYEYRKDILKEMMSHVRNGDKLDIMNMLREDKYVKRSIPGNITGLKIPASIQSNRTRF